MLRATSSSATSRASEHPSPSRSSTPSNLPSTCRRHRPTKYRSAACPVGLSGPTLRRVVLVIGALPLLAREWVLPAAARCGLEMRQHLAPFEGTAAPGFPDLPAVAGQSKSSVSDLNESGVDERSKAGCELVTARYVVVEGICGADHAAQGGASTRGGYRSQDPGIGTGPTSRFAHGGRLSRGAPRRGLRRWIAQPHALSSADECVQIEPPRG